MTFSSLIRQLEKQLKESEKYAVRYEKQAAELRNKLAAVAKITGKRLAGLISPVKRKKKGRMRGSLWSAPKKAKILKGKKWPKKHWRKGFKRAKGKIAVQRNERGGTKRGGRNPPK